MSIRNIKFLVPEEDRVEILYGNGFLLHVTDLRRDPNEDDEFYDPPTIGRDYE